VNGSRRGLDWILDSLATYAHDSELQAITAPPLISTVHKSPQHTLGPFQPAVFTSRSSVTASTSADFSASTRKFSLNGSSLLTAPFLHRLPYRTDLVNQRQLLYDWRFTADQLVLATRPLRLTTQNFIFQLNTCDHSPYIMSSLTRGWVCRLQLLLVLASAVILRSGSRETHDYIILSQIRDSPNLEGQVPMFISARNRVVQLYPQALGSHFVASHDSQGYGGGIRPRLHTGYQLTLLPQLSSL
jgi:hypothetical protein